MIENRNTNVSEWPCQRPSSNPTEMLWQGLRQAVFENLPTAEAVL